MKNGHIYTFAYGSNLDPAQMQSRCPSATLVGPARLPGYRLAFNRYSNVWKGGVADVVRDGSLDVWGLIWSIDPAEIEILDRFELVPTGYFRERIPVTTRDDDQVDAWTYQVHLKGVFVPPQARYLDIILTACKSFGFPTSYERSVALAAGGAQDDS